MPLCSITNGRWVAGAALLGGGGALAKLSSS
jgi:hypothetical protein